MASAWLSLAKTLGQERMRALREGKSLNWATSVISVRLRSGRYLGRGRVMETSWYRDEDDNYLSFEYKVHSIGPVVAIPTEFWQVTMDDGPTSMMNWEKNIAVFGTSGYRDIEVKRLTVVSRAGAKPQYPWKQFEGEAIRLLAEEGGFTEAFRLSDLERHMTEWADRNWEKTPAEASIRRRCKDAEHTYFMTKRLKAQN